MDSRSQRNSIVRFGEFELNLPTRELSGRRRTVKLQEQSYLLLATLLEHPGELVSRDELKHRLWPNHTFVDFEHSLNKAVNRLRESLDDPAAHPRYVQTLPRLGYRLIVPVAPAAVHDVHAEASHSRAAPRKFSARRRAVALAFAITVACLVTMRTIIRIARPTPIRSLAVLPLENVSGDPAQDHFAEGLTDELITHLGQISALRVISRTSVMQYKRTHKRLPAIGHELQVDAVIEGTVMRTGDYIRITAQLLDARSDKHLWARSYTGEVRNILMLQNQIASDVANYVQITLTGSEQQSLASSRAVDPLAYEAFLKGRYFADRRSKESIQKAVAYFEQATHHDPSFAAAYAGLAQVYAVEPGYLAERPVESYNRGKIAAEKALAMDESLADAHAALGILAINMDYDWETSERELQTAIRLNPGDATAHHWHALNLVSLGRQHEAAEEIERARQLDPLSVIITANKALVFYEARQFDRAIQAAESALELDPDNAVAHSYLGLALLKTGKLAQARLQFEHAAKVSGDLSPFAGQLAYTYATEGNREEALRILADLKKRSSREYVIPCSMAAAYTALGQEQQAIAYLQTAVNDHSDCVLLAAVDPLFDRVRGSAAFQELLQRIHLHSVRPG